MTHETPPAIRAEHELRYRLAVPAIRAAKTWGDLGCGSGLAAAGALGEDGFDGHALLVDVAQHAVEHAAGEVKARELTPLTADLAEAEGVAAVRDALLAAPAPRTVTCFETIEHLATFVPLLELLAELAEQHDTTVLISVPNDAFWAIENPHHATMWGEGSFEELRRLLPEGHVLGRQVALSGSALAGEEFTAAGSAPGDAVPTHFLAAFGPRAEPFAGQAVAATVDLLEQRRWERQRISDLTYLQASNDLLMDQVEELRAYQRRAIDEFVEWRSYIHELERELGRPPSGGDPPQLEAGAT